MTTPVLIAMGSRSDGEVMTDALVVLEQLGVGAELRVVSAHRTPEALFEVGRDAHNQGFRVLIAGAGGAAHLPGMLAALSPLPVIGVPIKSRNSLDGWDSLLSIVQMPRGVPVATVAVNGAGNAGLLAAQMMAIHDHELFARILQYRADVRAQVEAQQF